MSAKPWFAWFPADYRAKTAHLTFEQDGAYRRLLDAYYERRGPLPADRNALYRMAGAQDDRERTAVDVVATEFFTNGDGKLKHARCDEQIAREQALHQAWSEAGRKGGLKQAQSRLKRSRKGGSTIPDSDSHSDLNLKPIKSEALASSPNGLPAENAVISIPINNGTEYPITQNLVDEWIKLYPECDVLQTLKEIRGWNLANPSKRKTKSGILNHINRWLAKEQNRG
jgi:uncharacterized protein YdaU (DUF1376 family)